MRHRGSSGQFGYITAVIITFGTIRNPQTAYVYNACPYLLVIQPHMGHYLLVSDLILERHHLNLPSDRSLQSIYHLMWQSSTSKRNALKAFEWDLDRYTEGCEMNTSASSHSPRDIPAFWECTAYLSPIISPASDPLTFQAVLESYETPYQR